MTHRGIYFLFAAATLAIGCRNSEQATGGAGTVDAGNPGGDAGDEVGCPPLAPRTSAPERFIGPTEIVDEVLPVIASADQTLIVMMYQLSLDDFIDAIVA